VRLLALGTTAVRGLDERAVFVAFFTVTAGLLVTAGFLVTAVLGVFADLALFATACLDFGGALVAVGAASGGNNLLGTASWMLFVAWVKSTGSLDQWIISVAA
jgi:energy-coupling factor transporter transmembrane protein EcfT